MAQQKVELRKVRDFSDILNDTFLFIRQNLKPLIVGVFGIAGVFLLVSAILNGMYQGDKNNPFIQILSGNQYASGSPYDVFTGLYFVAQIVGLLAMTSVNVALICYMKLYELNGKEAPALVDVWNEFKKYFLLVAVYSIPVFILIIIGCMLCLLPGIYLAVVLAPFSAIIIIENETFGNAFNRCFQIIKENFWQSLGIYFVTLIICFFAATIVGTFLGVITGLLSYFTTKEISSTVATVTSVVNVISQVFYLILHIAVVLNYYNLVERFEGTGILQRLEGLGTSSTGPATNAEEEY